MSVCMCGRMRDEVEDGGGLWMREVVERCRQWLSSKGDALPRLQLIQPTLSPSGGPVQPQGTTREQEHASSPNRYSAHCTNAKEEGKCRDWHQ